LAPLYGFGIALIAMGILVLIYPMILAIMVAVAFISFGITLLGFAWKLKSSSESRNFEL